MSATWFYSIEISSLSQPTYLINIFTLRALYPKNQPTNLRELPC